MKKILIHTLVAATLTAGLSGCGDSFLETKFYKGQDIEKGLTSVPIVDAALNGAYDNFYNYRFAGNYALAIGDVSTDIAYWNGVTGHWSNIYGYSFLDTEGYLADIWEYGYKVIDNSTRVIEDASKLYASSTDAEKKNLDRDIAEAYALRGFSRLILTNIFGHQIKVNGKDFSDQPGILISDKVVGPEDQVKRATVDFFETYTADAHYMWQSGDNGWTPSEGYPRAVAIGKIPVVYARQDETETAIVNSLIARLETLLSNFADTNDYHASPKLFITGHIQGFSKKGEAGAIIEGDEGSTMNYVSWAHAPESVRLEIETILKMIYTLTQTPDISFDSVKGIGAVSGVALKLLFMDAHLKVQDKREIFDDYLQRRANIIKAYIGLFSPPLAAVADEMEITPEITPYMLTNEIDELNYWLTANGNKPVVSQEESIEKAGVSMNPQATYEKLQAEDARSVYTSAFEPTL